MVAFAIIAAVMVTAAALAISHTPRTLPPEVLEDWMSRHYW